MRRRTPASHGAWAPPGQGHVPVPLLLTILWVGLQEGHTHWLGGLVCRTPLGWRHLLNFLKYLKLERTPGALGALNGSFTASIKPVLDLCSSCLPKNAPSSGILYRFPVSHSRRDPGHCGQERWRGVNPTLASSYRL